MTQSVSAEMETTVGIVTQLTTTKMLTPDQSTLSLNLIRIFRNISIPLSDCFSPEIKLIPESNSPSTPLQFRRSQDFYILSIIKLNCNKSLSMTKQWTIKNYTTNDNSEIVMDKKIITTNSELYVPSNTFPYGMYQFKLTATITYYPALTNFSSIYIQISPSGITANLVELGTSVVTSGHQQNLILNPGNYSIDPDGYQFNASVCFSLHHKSYLNIHFQLIGLVLCLFLSSL